MKKHKFTYEKSGVNIKAADNFVKFISNISSKNKGNKKFNNIGGFGSISDIPKDFKRPKIVASTDGVGTKIEIANILNKYDTIGIDLVAMCVNDLIVQGAKPLLFLDYISINKIDLKKLKSIIKGIVKGCKISGCELVGGETAEMPGIYGVDEYDLAGFSVGVVERSQLIDGSNIKTGHIVLGLASSGPHSNGYSLIRKVLEQSGDNPSMRLSESSLGEALLAPTRIYVKPLLSLIVQHPLDGLAHITGGGISENIIRIIPAGLGLEIDLSAWQLPAVFEWLQTRGGIDQQEMLRTFNCGIGMVLLVAEDSADDICLALAAAGEPACRIGRVIEHIDFAPRVNYIRS